MTATSVTGSRRFMPGKARGLATARAQTPKTNKPSVGTPKVDLDAEKIVKDLQEKWDNVEDKTSVVVYGAGALVVLWLSSSLVSAINSLPLLPKLMELVGLAYSTWFVYRYLLFKESREELIADVDELKKKISGEK